jgi:hypothetical protein
MSAMTNPPGVLEGADDAPIPGVAEVPTVNE